MKKILLAGAVALFGLSNAQIAKGTTYLSGSVGYSQVESNNGNDKKKTSTYYLELVISLTQT
ncbi:hypothetical protein V2E39_23675 [Chryseobacterium arthrosphaerae]|uniref:Porin family protein n=1 Tax=Chryseobacterium arthrosphaerae TaxID=651561 RepID=A0ABU7R6J2_9FLAO